jgi:hypothetical protein
MVWAGKHRQKETEMFFVLLLFLQTQRQPFEEQLKGYVFHGLDWGVKKGGHGNCRNGKSSGSAYRDTDDGWNTKSNLVGVDEIEGLVTFEFYTWATYSEIEKEVELIGRNRGEEIKAKSHTGKGVVDILRIHIGSAVLEVGLLNKRVVVVLFRDAVGLK